ncbi:hypothetical protein M1116_03050 [Patescibacteria group bacterium]|nr:hypothetical protein [Patescibacteria group bacterium]
MNRLVEVSSKEIIKATVIQALKKSDLNGGLFFGGSWAYSLTPEVRDVDALFIFPTRSSLERFLQTATKSKLTECFGFDTGSIDYIKNYCNTLLINHQLEILRVSGKVNGIKTSIKLIGLDSIKLDDLNAERWYRVLSVNKDRRFYIGKSTVDENPTYRLLLNNTLGKFGQNTFYAFLDKDFARIPGGWSIGLFTDFLVTAQFAYANDKVVDNPYLKKQEEFKQYFIKRTRAAATGPNFQWTSLLVRQYRFSQEYQNKLESELRALAQKIKADSFTHDHLPEKAPTHFSLVLDTSLLSKKKIDWQEKKTSVVPFTAKPLSRQEIEKILDRGLRKSTGSGLKYFSFFKDDIFSINSRAGVCGDKKGRQYCFKTLKDGNKQNIFYEAMSSGLMNKIFSHTQKAIYIDRDYRVAIFPWFEGRPMVSYLLSDLNPELAEKYLTLELKKSEEILASNLASMDEVKNRDTTKENVHSLFYDRVTGGRWNEYYDNKIVQIHDKRYDFGKILQMETVVNGQHCKPLAQVINNSKYYLSPKLLDKGLKVYGLGDGHGGNVLVKPDFTDYLNIDYEYAGIHCPLLDAAKSIYHDIFVDVLLSNRISPLPVKVSCRVHNGKLYINHNYQLNPVKKAILEIKLGILNTTLREAQKRGYSSKNWEMILRSALAVCATLSRNILDYDTKHLWLAYALAVSFGTPRNGQFVNLLHSPLAHA